jgi:anti-sigma regulatory factor (Ser/Thr protein kinase)
MLIGRELFVLITDKGFGSPPFLWLPLRTGDKEKPFIFSEYEGFGLLLASLVFDALRYGRKMNLSVLSFVFQ